MTTQEHHLNCPNCGQDIDVKQVLVTQIESKLTQDFADKQKALKESEKEAQAALAAERKALDQERAQQAQLIENAIESELKQREAETYANLKAKIEREQKEAHEAISKELDEKTKALANLHKLQAEIERLKRDKTALRDTIELEAEKKLTQRLAKEVEAYKKTVDEKSSLEVLELKKQLDNVKNQLAMANKKAHQGSMQIQGEAQELAMEAWLTEQFPLDEIEEIKKGARGADCLQSVVSPSGRPSGRILYESKRTKSFQPAWIEKFKADIRDTQADIGVLVTEAMPKDMTQFGLKDGIYICTFSEFKALSHVLRQSLIELKRTARLEENKGDVKTMLYQYFTSNEFKGQIEAIVESFSQIQQDLDKEKIAMKSLWKKREKQLTKVLENTTYLYSSVKGIGGRVVGEVEALEFGVEAKEPARILTFESK